MLFNDAGQPPLAISQPAHAWLSGQLLQAWAEPLPVAVLLAAEQHDIGWLDWETAPSFDPATGRPHLFRHVPATVHAPMWARGVERALHAWGSHAALLVSRHGSHIYNRFTDRSRLGAADAAAVGRYLDTQAVLQAGWATSLGLDERALDRETAFVALSDTLSLAMCGELRTPLTLEAPAREGGTRPIAVNAGGPAEFTLNPWPFRPGPLTLSVEARPLPPGGRFGSAAEMQAWHAGGARAEMGVRLTPGEGAPAQGPTRGAPAT